MGDTSGAELFGKIFRRLAKDPDDARRKSLVMFFWKEAREHDFYACEMDADAALKKLGLAKKGRNEDGEITTLYRRDGRWQE